MMQNKTRNLMCSCKMTRNVVAAHHILNPGERESLNIDQEVLQFMTVIKVEEPHALNEPTKHARTTQLQLRPELQWWQSL
mmetsp:Transcript_18132/g.32835  ORF Transcript_18132/g.32835 Transcript_18132/m.32835 type:complete len:80 (+) Transcript_18132:213-452(+)